MDKQEQEEAAQRRTLRHLADCAAALAGLPQCLLSVSYTKRQLEAQLGSSAGGGSGRKKALGKLAGNSAVLQASGGEEVCQFCCKKRDVKSDSVTTVGGWQTKQQLHRICIKCGFCRRPYVTEEFKMLLQTEPTKRAAPPVALQQDSSQWDLKRKKRNKGDPNAGLLIPGRQQPLAGTLPAAAPKAAVDRKKLKAFLAQDKPVESNSSSKLQNFLKLL